MDVASQIAVMNHARIEQVGTPTELYDEPTTEFVMRFVGEANAPRRRVGAAARARDRRASRRTDAVEAMVERITLYGFDARVELARARATALTVQLTRERLEELELEQGQIVWVRAARERSFASGVRLKSAASASSAPARVDAPALQTDARSASDARRRRRGRRASSPRARRASRARRSIQTGCSAAALPAYSTSSGRVAAHRGDRPFDRADHVGDADLVGGPREHVAAFDAALARDELRVAQLEQDVLEEVPRDRLRRRELLALDERSGRGELEHRAERVVDLGGDAHARNRTRRAIARRDSSSPSS